MSEPTETEPTETEPTEGHDDTPSLRQRLHAATGDRDAEAAAVADRAGDEVELDDAKVAVQEAHGESVSGRVREHDLATVEDARDVAEDGTATP